MIVPTIGRVVLFRKATMSSEAQPYPAFICYVHSDRCINVAGFDSNGDPFKRTSVQLIQDNDACQGGDTAEWMPYQVLQAKKAETSAVNVPQEPMV